MFNSKLLSPFYIFQTFCMLDNAYVKEYRKLPSLEEVLTVSLTEASSLCLLTALERKAKELGDQNLSIQSYCYLSGLAVFKEQS